MQELLSVVRAGFVFILLMLWPGCAPQSFRAVEDSRAGAALNNRVSVVYSRYYQIDMGGFEKLHPFDIHKYARIYLKLVTEGQIKPQDVFVPEAVRDDQVRLVQSQAFLDSLADPATVARYLEAPVVGLVPAGLIEAGIVRSFRTATGGTILAARQALRHGIAINLAGGYHHAMPDHGEGFNVFADMPIAIAVLKKERLVRRVLVVDVDVHQGNGTIVCTRGDKDVFILDLHEGDIYPIPKQRGPMDIPLPAGAGDKEVLSALRHCLPLAFERAKPDIVFLQGGCDMLAGDPLARLQMTSGGIVQRDAMVIDECVRRGVPVVMVLGGGYSRGAWAAQYASVSRTIGKYGLANPETRSQRRERTLSEKLYTK